MITPFSLLHLRKLKEHEIREILGKGISYEKYLSNINSIAIKVVNEITASLNNDYEIVETMLDIVSSLALTLIKNYKPKTRKDIVSYLLAFRKIIEDEIDLLIYNIDKIDDIMKISEESKKTYTV